MADTETPHQLIAFAVSYDVTTGREEIVRGALVLPKHSILFDLRGRGSGAVMIDTKESIGWGYMPKTEMQAIRDAWDALNKE